MLTEQEIRQALHADRVVPFPVPNPHGPLGLEHLAGMLGQIAEAYSGLSHRPRVRRPIELTVETWEQLDRLANATTQAGSRHVTASDVAAAIIERFVVAEQA